jgi:hypothetical protein
MGRVGRHRVDRALVAVEAEIVGTLLLPPKALFDLAGQSVGLRAKASREAPVAEGVLSDVGPCSLCRHDQALVLTEGDWKCGE